VDSDSDYYAMLGLASTAEVEVIQAVYRALAKKYHPDVYQGDKAEAERIMKDLNEAISILSAPKLREQYDSTRENKSNSTGDFDETVHEAKSSEEEIFEASVEEIFTQGAEFYPGVKEYRNRLARLSHTLSIAYVAHIVERKEFEKANDIYTALRQEFYFKYFGSATEVLQLAEYLLDENSSQVSSERRAKAKKLNQAIKVVGTPSDSVTFVRKFMDLNGLYETEIYPDFLKSGSKGLSTFEFFILLFMFVVLVVAVTQS
jgi:curved DNA-binding protein CbpA